MTMRTYTSTRHLAWLSALCILSLLMLVGLTGCDAANLSAADTTPGTPIPSAGQEATPAAQVKPHSSPMPPEPLDLIAPIAATPSATSEPPAPEVDAGVGWQVYRSPQGDFSVEYPADWTVSEQAGDSSLTVLFSPPDGRAGITLTTLAGEQYSDFSDIPNTRCQPVTIGQLSGARCFDTISFSTSTTLVGEGKSYTIATSGKNVNVDIYQRFLDTFAIIP
jgi:hypothetical protein